MVVVQSTRLDVSEVAIWHWTSRRFLGTCYQSSFSIGFRKTQVLTPANASEAGYMTLLVRMRAHKTKSFPLPCHLMWSSNRDVAQIRVGLLTSNNSVKKSSNRSAQMLEFQLISDVVKLTTKISHHITQKKCHMIDKTLEKVIFCH